MAANGGIIGPVNTISFGKGKITSITASGPTSPALAATQPGTRLINALVVAGGGSGGVDGSAGGGAGGVRTLTDIQVCGATALGAAVVGAGGGTESSGSGNDGTDSSLIVGCTTYTSTGGGGGG